MHDDSRQAGRKQARKHGKSSRSSAARVEAGKRRRNNLLKGAPSIKSSRGRRLMSPVALSIVLLGGSWHGRAADEGWEEEEDGDKGEGVGGDRRGGEGGDAGC